MAVRSKAGAEGAGAGQKTQATPSSLENFYIMCGPEEKLAQLVGFLKVLHCCAGYLDDVPGGQVVVLRHNLSARFISAGFLTASDV